mgnify:CR=1 FL=1
MADMTTKILAVELKADDAIISVSFMGYATQEIVVGDRKVIDVLNKIPERKGFFRAIS